MSPTLRLESSTLERDHVGRHRTPRRVSLYSCGLLVGAFLVVGVVALAGGAWPAPGSVLLLAIPLALCMNRFVFFPNETGVTADAAVIFAAVVAFHDVSPWLGPLLVALLVGPLDAKHWSERAFVRMAYNSGSTALVTAAALVAFDGCTSVLGSSGGTLVGAAAVAAVPYVFAESAFGVVLVSLLGERPGAALRHQLPLNMLALPLALVGAATGLAALDVGWWSAALLLLPTPLVPEVALVELPRRLRGRRGRPTARRLLTGGSVLVIATVAIPEPVLATPLALLAIGCLLAAETRPGHGVRSQPLVALLVVVPLAALLDTASSRAVIAAATAGAVMAVVVVRPRERALWALPFLAVGACLAREWEFVGRFGALFFCVGMLVSLGAAAAWGPLPWPSRLVGPAFAQSSPLVRWRLFLTLATAVVVAAVLATGTSGDARAVLALTTTALLEIGVAAAALAVRMWRFAPRRRRVEAGVLGAIALAALFAYLPLALDGTRWSVLVAGAGVAGTGWLLAPSSRTARRRPSRVRGRRGSGSCARRCSGR